MRWETGWGGERVCVSHYMKDNVHEHLVIIQIGLGRGYCLCWNTNLEIQLKMFFQSYLDS